MSKLDWYLRSNLKFRHLQLLVTLDEMRHIGRTAHYLNVSQPAISKTLSTFEEGLNIQLFERTTRGMEPTEAGVCLIKYAKKILNEIANARDELIDISEGRVTRLSLGVLPAAALFILPQFIAQIESKMTATSVTVREGNTDFLLSMLRSGELDFVISNLTNKPLGVEFQTQLLYQDSIVVAVRKGHPLTTQTQVKWTALSDYPMVLPPAFALTRVSIEAFLLKHKVSLSRRYVESLSTLTNIGVLQETESVGFLSKVVADYFVKAGQIELLPLDLSNIHIDIGIVWLTDKKISSAQKVVMDLLKSQGGGEDVMI